MKLLNENSMEELGCVNKDFLFFKEILSYIPTEILKGEKEDESTNLNEVFSLKIPAQQQNEKYPEVVTKLKNKKQKKKKGKKKEEKKLLGLTPRQEELREKLRKRIEELHGKNKHLSSDELKEKKRLKRRESKLKLKAKRKSGKGNIGKGIDIPVVNGDSTGKKLSKEPKKSLVNQEGNLVFSKFDFSDRQKKTHSSDLVGKDYKRILEKLEKRKEKLTKLREKDSDLAQKLEEKTSWKSAILRAEGEKIKDDVKLVKKSLKQKEKKKQQRQKKWKSREDQVKARQNKQQEKRQKNIQARIDAKREKKMKKAKKKGRNIPGF